MARPWSRRESSRTSYTHVQRARRGCCRIKNHTRHLVWPHIHRPSFPLSNNKLQYRRRLHGSFLAHGVAHRAPPGRRSLAATLGLDGGILARHGVPTPSPPCSRSSRPTSRSPCAATTTTSAPRSRPVDEVVGGLGLPCSPCPPFGIHLRHHAKTNHPEHDPDMWASGTVSRSPGAASPSWSLLRGVPWLPRTQLRRRLPCRPSPSATCWRRPVSSHPCCPGRIHRRVGVIVPGWLATALLCCSSTGCTIPTRCRVATSTPGRSSGSSSRC